MNSTQADVDIAFIQAKTKTSIALAVGGISTLGAGVMVFLQGISGPGQTLLGVVGVEMSSTLLGCVIMATSGLWAFFSYKSRPIFPQIQQPLDRYATKDAITNRADSSSSTPTSVGATLSTRPIE